MLDNTIKFPYIDEHSGEENPLLEIGAVLNDLVDKVAEKCHADETVTRYFRQFARVDKQFLRMMSMSDTHAVRT